MSASDRLILLACWLLGIICVFALAMSLIIREPNWILHTITYVSCIGAALFNGLTVKARNR